MQINRERGERLLEMRNYETLKKTNTTLGEVERSAAKQVRERYRKSLEEQIANDQRLKSLN